eukprot:TRINITY_DN25872_c0_g1_i1.p1 TRINITY_DN25872_c0_g1~~TRINITY_DN25872_c0_g1_i1.p1  ORF type:complete len:864 (+),score=215.95 TRINITY_DN25872_c0_g1_i1:44-2635(+)
MPRPSERHLVVVVGGQGSAGVCRAVADKGGPSCLVLPLGCSLVGGLSLAGERAARDIASTCRLAAELNKPVGKVSLVGLGIGGLICRAAVGALLTHWPQLLSQTVRCAAFVSVATPHLGWLPSPAGGADRWLRRAALLGSSVYGATLRELLLVDKGRAVLGLSAPTSPCSTALRLFARRVCYSGVGSAVGGCAASCLMLPCAPQIAAGVETVLDSAATAAAVKAADPEAVDLPPPCVRFSARPAPPFLRLAQPPRGTAAAAERVPAPRLRRNSGTPVAAGSVPRLPSFSSSARAPTLPEFTPILEASGKDFGEGSVVMGTISKCYIGGCAGRLIERGKGDVDGQDFACESLKDCEVRMLDRAQTVSVHECVDSTFVLGPVSGSARICNSTNCMVHCAAQQVTVRGCTSMVLHVHSPRSVVVESSTGVVLRPYAVAMPHAEELWRESGLPLGRPNLYSTVVDLSAEDPSVPVPHYVVDAVRTPVPVVRHTSPSAPGVRPELPAHIGTALDQLKDAPARAPSRALTAESRSQLRLGNSGRAALSTAPFERVSSPAPSTDSESASEHTDDGDISRGRLGGILSPLRYRATRACSEGDQSDVWVRGAVGQRVTRGFGSLRGAVFGVQNLEACLIVAADWSGSVLVDRVVHSCVVIGPCAGTVIIADCQFTRVFAFCGSLRLRGCKNVAVHVWSPTRPICDHCTGVTFAPWNLALPRLTALCESARLDPSAPNLWHAPRGPEEGWSLTGAVETNPTPIEMVGEPPPEMPPALLAALRLEVHFPETAAEGGLRRRLNEALMSARQLRWERVLLGGWAAHAFAAGGTLPFSCGLFGAAASHIADSVFKEADPQALGVAAHDTGATALGPR